MTTRLVQSPQLTVHDKIERNRQIVAIRRFRDAAETRLPWAAPRIDAHLARRVAERGW